MFFNLVCRIYVLKSRIQQNPEYQNKYDSRVRENPSNIHEVTSPQIEKPIRLNDIHDISEI